MSGEKTRMLDTLLKLLQVMRSRTFVHVDKTIAQLTKVRTPRRLKKMSRLIIKTHHRRFSFAPSAHYEVRIKP